jgi:flagellar protein FliS
MVNKGYSAYNNSKILTASPAELTLMLYEGAIKFCNVALVGLEQNDIEKAHTGMMKAQRIVNEFRATLDFKYEISKSLT